MTECRLPEVSHSSVEMLDQVERSLGGQVQVEGRRTGGSSATGIREFDSCRMWELMWEDRVQLEAVQRENRVHWEEEKKRREYENVQQMKNMQDQLDLMKSMMNRSQNREDEVTRRKKIGFDQLKLTKFTDSEDIEAYLTTFERMMKVYEVEKERWAHLLAPQLTGKVQQAYTALNVEDAVKYDEVKMAIVKK